MLTQIFPGLRAGAPAAPFTIRFGAVELDAYAEPSGEAALHLPLPWLGGNRSERLFPGAEFRGESAGFRLYERDDLLLGFCVEPARRDLTVQAHAFYRRILEFTGDSYLCRVWNYVPAINRITDNLENYKAFCRGRALAFQAAYGETFQNYLPAASAVGGTDDRLAVVFVASREMPRHVENPEQVPAYRYPSDYGPSAPSFSRATILSDTAGTPTTVFVSGTASIKGHETLHADDLAGQIDCTLDNLRLISRASGLGDALGAGGPWQRHFKIYVRHEKNLPTVSNELNRRLLLSDDRVIWLRADICRQPLELEIEATLVAR